MLRIFDLPILQWTCLFCVYCSTSAAAPPAIPNELLQFTPYVSNPIFSSAMQDKWDAQLRERGWIMKSRDCWWMWYTGYDGERDSVKSLGLATSKDGIQWKRHPRNPLTKNLWVEDMMVIEVDGVFHMFAEGRNDQAHRLTSIDGINWKPQGTLDVRKTDNTSVEPGPLGTPTAYYEAKIWYLFYERRDAGIWLASSTDLKVWKNLQDTPVLTPGPEPFDRDLIALNQIFKYNGRYYASIHGASNVNDPRLWASGIAVSDDLIHWQKSPRPLRPVEENKSSGLFIHDGKQFHFYTMHNQVDLYLPVHTVSPSVTD